MKPKIVKFCKSCRHHSNFRQGIREKCQYCQRANLLNSRTKISPEERLLQEIFSETNGRFHVLTPPPPPHNKNYKGKRPL